MAARVPVEPGRRRGVVTSSLVVLSPSPGLSLTQTK